MVSPVFTIPFVVALVVVVVVGSSEDSLARVASLTTPLVSEGTDGSSDGTDVVSDGAAVVSEDVVPDS